MALLSRLLSRAQAQVAPPSHTNDLGDTDYAAVFAASCKPMRQLAILAPQPKSPDVTRKAPSRRNYRAAPMGKRVQLVVRVSPAVKRDVKLAAKRARTSASAWVADVIAEALARGVQ